MNIVKGTEDSGFSDFIWLDKKYKPVLSKSASSWDNSYCMRLVIVSLDVNVGRIQFLVADNLCSFSSCKCI